MLTPETERFGSTNLCFEKFVVAVIVVVIVQRKPTNTQIQVGIAGDNLCQPELGADILCQLQAGMDSQTGGVVVLERSKPSRIHY